MNGIQEVSGSIPLISTKIGHSVSEEKISKLYGFGIFSFYLSLKIFDFCYIIFLPSNTPFLYRNYSSRTPAESAGLDKRHYISVQATAWIGKSFIVFGNCSLLRRFLSMSIIQCHMAFKRSAVRSRLSLPNTFEIFAFRWLFFALEAKTRILPHFAELPDTYLTTN